MKVSEAIKNAPVLDGKVTTIEGLFIMKMDLGYIIDSKIDIETPAMAIEVKAPDLKKRLLTTVPAFGGSQYSYCNEAKITGVVAVAHESKFPCLISNITEIEIFMHGEVFKLSL